MQDDSVAFVIVCWNSRDRLDACLTSIYRQTAGRAGIVVVDNGSEDGSQEHVRTHHPRVTLIEAGRNLRFPAACNIGIRAAFADPACEYVGLLNDDAWLADDWLEVLLAFAEQHPEGASFQGLIVDGQDHEVIDSYGLYIGHAGRAIQMGYRSRSRPPSTGEVFGVNAAAALYRRAFFSAQPFGEEYFDADLQMYLEDVDVAARAVVMGWKNFFVGQALAYHLGSGGGREDRTLSLLMTCRNDVLVLIKNLPWSVVVKAAPGMVHAELARYWGFIKRRDYAKVSTMLHGRALGVINVPTFLRKRSVLRPYRTVSKDRLLELMSGTTTASEESGDNG